MDKIRELPEQEDRVETGPIQFGDDWPGVFIRGDNAAWHAHCISSLIGRAKSGECLQDYDILHLQSLLDLLVRSNVSNFTPAAPTRSFCSEEE